MQLPRAFKCAAFAIAVVALSTDVGMGESSSMPLPLRVVGTQILNSKNEPVRLRGVNCASLEWTSNGERHIVESVRVAIDDWRVNHIRLPLSQDRWFGRAPEQKDEGKTYRALVDEVVQLCASKGVYIMLDLHWSNAGVWGEQIGQHSMPDEHSLTFWKDLAPIYANHPAVIYDLYNEPHDVSWDVWLNGGEITDRANRRGQTPRTFRAVGMQQLFDAVRATGAKNLIVVGGLDWAYDFSGILDGRQFKDPDGNGVIYANHCYNNKNQAVETWIANMEKAAEKLPIVISEFGGAYFRPGETLPRPRRGFGGMRRNDGDWLMRVLQAIEDHQWSYTAWDFHPAAGPTLITGWDYEPTPHFGVYIKLMLAGTLPRYTPPAQSSGDSDATLKLTDPLATPETKALYQNLQKVAQKGILFGHQDTLAYGVGWKAARDDFDSDVHRVCGKFPSVFGWDLGHIGTPANIDGVPFENMKVWIAKGYERGGISTISWHARVPGTGQSSWTRKKVVGSLLPGGDNHEAFVEKLDQVAAFISDLKGSKGEPIPIIFRPYHEHNGDWFWWGAKWCAPDEYKQLWRFTTDHLRKTKGLHNIISRATRPIASKTARSISNAIPGTTSLMSSVTTTTEISSRPKQETRPGSRWRP